MNDGKNKLTASKPDASYDVGYAKPPKQSQFPPGKSGNPKGRPKGSKNKRPALNEERLKSIVLDEAYRNNAVRDGHRNVSMPMAQAIVRSLAVNAAKGQHRAQRLFAEMLSATERQNKDLADEFVKSLVNYKIDWNHELDRRVRQGITHLPDPIPHPDHVKIDMNTGKAWVEGPITNDDVAELEEWARKRDGFKEEVDFLRSDLETEVDDEQRAFREGDLAHAEKMVKLIQKVLDLNGFKEPD